MQAEFIIIPILSYLLCSVNFSIILFKLTGRGDPRDRYSGNAGATNVYRQAGRAMAVMVLLMDAARGALIAVISAEFADGWIVPWSCLGALIGNRYPVFHGFRGGKGVATLLGFGAAVSLVFMGISCLVWLALYAIFRKPFIGSFGMIAVIAVGLGYAGNEPAGIVAAVLCAGFAVFNHKENIKCLK
jgi:glycerol-3-phosphate acyltransferase PlsY